MATLRGCIPALLALTLAGCAMRPAGEAGERARLKEAGRAYTEPVNLPELPEHPELDDYLQYALLNNAGLRAQYWQWRALIERVPQVSSWPRLMLSMDVMFTRENMRLWDRTTLGIANDNNMPIQSPTKLKSRGRIALSDAQAAGERFQTAKFLLQQQLENAYYDLALLAETLRIQGENVTLLEMISEQTASRVRSGTTSQADLLGSLTNLDLARNELQNMQSQAPPLAARLNAILGRTAQAPVPLPQRLPEPRPLPAEDDALIAMAAERSPELAALAREVAGRKEALSLARQQWIPDLNLAGSLTGDISQMIGAMLMLPTNIESIRGGIAQARASIQSAEAAREQYGRDLAASFVLNLYVLRNDERQVELFEKVIIPRAEQTVSVAAASYANDRVTFVNLLDAQRTLLDARLAAAQLRIEREKALAAIETWSAVDVQAMPRTRMSAPAGGMGGAAAATAMGSESDGGGM